MTTNEHEEAARTRKAVVLVQALRKHLPDAACTDLAIVADRMTDVQWADVARLADVRAPSRATVRMICELLQAQTREDDHIAKKMRDNPGMSYADVIFKEL